MVKIGFIGLGNMGAPMAKNLLNAGHQVTVYDINATAMTALVTAGALPAASVAAAAKQQHVIITMLQSGAQLTAVCLSNAGIYHHAMLASLHIDCSSIDVATSRLLHQEANAVGVHTLDAPVSGGVIGATNATLTFMVGGEVAVFNQALPLLQIMGKKIVHAGGAGNGQVAKICNNMLLGISMIGVAEAFTLAEKLGLAPKTLFEIASHASGECWAMTHYSPVPGLVANVPANNGYKPGFSAQMMLKDLRLSQDAAASMALKTPLGAAAMALYQQFVTECDSGNSDFSGIIKMIAKNDDETDAS